MRRVLILAVTALAVLIGVGAFASTPGGGGVSAIPAPDSPYKSKDKQYVDIPRVLPGTLLADALTLINTAPTARTVLLYGVDAVPARGGYGFTLRGQPVTRVGAWLRLPAPQVTVQPGKTVRIPYSIRVSSAARGGTYVGGIAVEPVDQKSTGAFSTRTRFVMAVRLVVPGGAPGVTPGLGSPTGRFHLVRVDVRTRGRRLCPSVSYRNDSRDVLDPVATVEADGTFGQRVLTRRSSVGSVAPEQTVHADLPCVRRPLGRYTLRVRVRTPAGEGATDTHGFYLPLVLLAALLALLLVIAALVTTFVRGARRRTR